MPPCTAPSSPISPLLTMSRSVIGRRISGSWTVARAAFTCSVVGVEDMYPMVVKPRGVKHTGGYLVRVPLSAGQQGIPGSAPEGPHTPGPECRTPRPLEESYRAAPGADGRGARERSEEHTSELQSRE